MSADLTDAEKAATDVWSHGPHDKHQMLLAVNAAIAVAERRYEQSEDARLVFAQCAAKKLAHALDEIGARIYRDINPDSSYQPIADERLANLLSDFTAHAEEHLAVLDNANVRQVLDDAKKEADR